MTDNPGQPVRLRIGMTGFLPPQAVGWDRDLSAHIECRDIIESARDVLSLMQATISQLVIVLVHSGIGPLTPRPKMKHAATALTATDGINVVIAGHSHQVFPSPHIPPGPGIGPPKGDAGGQARGDGGLRRLSSGGDRPSAARHRPDTDQGFPRRGATGLHRDPPATHVAAPALSAHRATLRHFRRRIGHVGKPLHSFFALIGDGPGLRLVSIAQRWHIRRQLRNDLAGLPVLSVAAPFRAGGRGGPQHCTNVAAGALTLRNLADLYLFPNRICAVQSDRGAVAAMA